MRHLAALLSLAVIAALAATGAQAQAWPSRPVRTIVPYPAGGVADVLVRQIMDKLSQRIGQPVVVDNRPGASGLIGLETTAKSPPDGYTITIASNDAAWVNQIVKTGFDLRRDLAPITLMRRAAFVAWVTGSLPAQTVGEFIAYAKANPGKLNYGSAGPGSGNHLGTESLKLAVPGLSMTHVPFKGEAPTATALAAGEIHFVLGTYGSYAPHVPSGKVRPLAVTGERRLPALPQTPSFTEAGVKYTNHYWSGFFGPAGLPRDIAGRIASELRAIYQLPDVLPNMTRAGEEVGSQTPEEFAKIVADEIESRSAAVKAASLRPE